uniref:Protein-S-isoprenylcysteine O-methyltransferase Ste14 n=1 Tax=Candidatus Kentrum sp. MB TaxID=2138164 RepID=A0A451BCH2_9GAMM|nr:MAG: Protein-S-isoprenylcysteine O-methyltransferase Ste14 [Candidatus Kentron sp. MB]VFK32563.1 MAG: Protein-S-isoprenylcysteine O-methyltransferase Ste14 [Candidatus Kentron sp. MB]VFK75981.1 MAG: Protein-S-isoprenylcysteine O-methyltransferase Ste14 [Candidatus Kentron sp. MB]
MPSATIPFSIYLFAGLSLTVGFGSLIVFAFFLYLGSFPWVVLPLGVTEGLLFDVALCFAFFLQHTGMTRIRAKSKQFLGRNFKAIFSIVSGVFLVAFMVLWQKSSLSLVSADGFWGGLLRVIFFIGVAGQLWTTFSLTSIDPFGVQDLLARPGSKANSEAPSLVVKNAYAWVRHPAYFTMLLLIWGYPDLTADRLLLNVLFTVWIVMGTLYEERELAALFGEEYLTYQREVPMLIPYRLPKRNRR